MNMRKLILPLLIVTVPAFATGKLFVVVHTTDAIVRNYVCSNGLDGTDNGILVGSAMASSGSFIWHAVGGVAPYRVISPVNSAMGGCITVMDAEGETATGCGTVKVKRINIPVNCENGNQPLPAPAKAKEVKKPQGEVVPTDSMGPVTPVTNDPVELTTKGGAVDTKTPVKRNPTTTPAPTPRPHGSAPVNREPLKGNGQSIGTHSGTTITRPSVPRGTTNTGGSGTNNGTTVTPMKPY